MHPDRKDPYLCPFLSINVMRSEPSDFHTFEGGDCPRNPKMATFEQDEKAGTFAGCSANFVTTVLQVCAAAAFVSSAKSQCVHPERKDPYLCRVPKFDIKKEQFSTVFN